MIFLNNTNTVFNMGESKTPDWLLHERLKNLEEREKTLKLSREIQQKERSVKHLERETHPSKKRKLFNVSKRVGKSVVNYVDDLADTHIQSPQPRHLSSQVPSSSPQPPRKHKMRRPKKKRKKYPQRGVVSSLFGY